MSKVILVNPANATVGYSVIPPRWLVVIAGATPTNLVGDPVIIDVPVTPFKAEDVAAGDIVGIGIHSGNCRSAYQIIREAKQRGAIVIAGGIHPTLFPEEPLEMGADAVVKGGADLIWSQVVEDALRGRLERVYDGGRVPGELMVKARWDLLDPKKYLIASVQAVAGCPENCSFCSVWVTDGRTPRMHLNEQIIEEANELHAMGFRYVFFADDNFTPATLARIAREKNKQTKALLEGVREERLRLFDAYHRSVPSSLYAFTQMTAEVIGDDEYLDAMYHEMVRDWKNRDAPDYVPKHSAKIVGDKFWLDYEHWEIAVKHPTIAVDDLKKEVHKSWRSFYSLRAIIKRTRQGPLGTLTPGGKLFYAATCLVFQSLYPRGIAADNVRNTKLGLFARLAVRALIALSRGRRRDWFGMRPRGEEFKVA